jgi:hypothetical protein
MTLLLNLSDGSLRGQPMLASLPLHSGGPILHGDSDNELRAAVRSGPLPSRRRRPQLDLP